MFRLLLLIGLVPSVIGCQSSPTTPTEDPVPLTVLRFDGFAQPLTDYSGLSDPVRTIVRDAGTWQATWAAIFSNRSPRPPLPAVDFSREMVVVVALGERPTGGHGILIEGATEVPNGVTVQLRSVTPGFGCAVTLALTQSVDAARVPRRESAVVFAERTTITQCQ